MTTLSRRTFLVAVGSLTSALAVWARWSATGLSEPGTLLTAREATILLAALTAFVDEPARDGFIERVDRYLAHTPAQTQREVSGLLAVVEHAAPLTIAESKRFSSLSVELRRRTLDHLNERGRMGALVVRSLRDLCYLGHYSSERAWSALGYEGPLVGRAAARSRHYDRLLAPPGAKPEGWRDDS